MGENKRAKGAKSLRAAIARVRSRLAWPVEVEPSPASAYEIVSFPQERRHLIRYPLGGSQPREIELLHELVHAWLAETVSPQFSGACLGPGTPPEAVAALAPLTRAAGDWYVDERIHRLAPAALKAEVAEHWEYCRQLGQDETPPWVTVACGLIEAQAVRYLGHQPPYRQPELVRAFLAHPPDQPSLAALESLLNALAVATGCPYRVSQAVSPDGLPAWLVRCVQTGASP